MTSSYQFTGPALLAVVGPVLLIAAVTSGCGYGSGASFDTGAEPAPSGGTIGTGGTAGTNASGGTTESGGTAGTNASGGTTESGGTGEATGGGSTSTNAAPAWGTPVAGGPTGTGVTATVTVNPSRTVGTIGPGFAGFSYEKTHITNGSLTGTNADLVALYKLVGSPLMRLGADDVENCNWAGSGTAPAGPSGQPFAKTITTGNVDQLCSFLAATGTKIIYAVNFKSRNVSASAAEASYAQGKCGSSIYGFEIGNELNFDGSWASLKSQWESLATAIVATPGAVLVGPASYVGSAATFSAPFASDESPKFGSKLVLLTQHYYAGRAGTSSATVSQLQTPDPSSPTSQSGLLFTDTTMNAAVIANKIPMGYRLDESNTFAGHGQQGVSDALISGLWGLDFMLVTAEHGGSGVNFHGGETGMDGTVPFYYEPIMENKGVVVQVHPVYYSMLILNLAGTGPVVSTSVTTSNPNFTAYAIKADGFTSVILDNKNATNGVSATVNLGTAVSTASAIYLQATPAGSLSAPATGVTLAGAPVLANGTWNRNPPYIEATSGNTVSVFVPPASAALVRISQ